MSGRVSRPATRSSGRRSSRCGSTTCRAAADEAARLAAARRRHAWRRRSAAARARTPRPSSGCGCRRRRSTTTVAHLAALGDERDRRARHEDVTDQVVDLESRLATQRASVARVRALLDGAEPRRRGADRGRADPAHRRPRVAAGPARRARGQVELSTITRAAWSATRRPEPRRPGPRGFTDGLAAGWEALVAGRPGRRRDRRRAAAVLAAAAPRRRPRVALRGAGRGAGGRLAVPSAHGLVRQCDPRRGRARAVYEESSWLVENKTIDHLDVHCRAYLAVCGFVRARQRRRAGPRRRHAARRPARVRLGARRPDDRDPGRHRQPPHRHPAQRRADRAARHAAPAARPRPDAARQRPGLREHRPAAARAR